MNSHTGANNEVSLVIKSDYLQVQMRYKMDDSLLCSSDKATVLYDFGRLGMQDYFMAFFVFLRDTSTFFKLCAKHLTGSKEARKSIQVWNMNYYFTTQLYLS